LTSSPLYKWTILALTALTGALALAAPGMALSVLFSEITEDIHLNLVQVGLIWSIGMLPAMFMSMIGGAITDRFGPKKVMIVAVLLISLTGAARGLATDFPTFLIAVLLVGFLSPLVTTSAYKISGLWFRREQLGIANGIFAAGMAAGFLVGALISANLLSPWLGGWRQVMYFYGLIACLLLIPWMFAHPIPVRAVNGSAAVAPVPMRKALAHVIGLRDVWLLGITVFGIGGSAQGVTGYLPIYLRELGWSGVQADGALSLFHAASLVFVIPFALASDRLKHRQPLLMGMLVLVFAGSLLMTIAQGSLIWIAILMMGMVRDGSMAVVMSMVIGTKGVGPEYAGSASGLSIMLLSLGSFLGPPLGNQLASISPSLPFAFWAGLGAVGLVSLFFARKDPRAGAFDPIEGGVRR